MKLISLIVGVFAYLCVLYSCSAPYAKPSKKKSLIIYSDVFTSQDTSLFKAFKLKYKSKIIIRNVAYDSLTTLLEKNDFRGDIFLYSSLYRMKQLDNLKILYRFKEPIFTERLNPKYHSSNRSFFAIMKNPYAFANSNDSIHKFKNYDELLYSDLNKYWISNLNRIQYIPFLTGVLLKSKSKNDDKWINKFLKNLDLTKHRLDSLKTNEAPIMEFGPYSDLSLKYRKEEIIIPNQTHSGALNDFLCAGIYNKAENFNDAREFIDVLLQMQTQFLMKEKIHYFSILNVKPKQYLDNRYSIRQLEKYLLKVNRLYK